MESIKEINLHSAEVYFQTTTKDEPFPVELAPWMVWAVTQMRAGETVTAEDIERFMAMGTTDA